jgi:hypothetical protein
VMDCPGICIRRKLSVLVNGLLQFNSGSDLVCSDLNWVFSKYKYNLDVLKLAYKAFNNISPEYFRDYFCTNIVEDSHKTSGVPNSRFRDLICW